VLADEPTAHLDAETAQFVRQGLLALAARGATLVVATHDPLLAACMDRVLSLDGSQPPIAAGLPAAMRSIA
jgi:ATP-binding cassette subfamily C protein CydD